MPVSNPNKANQYDIDPRQNLCWGFYVDPESETFSNATKSAIKAGYTPTTADQITTHDWFIGKTRRLNIRNKAEKVLEEMLDMPVNVLSWEGKGDEAEQVVQTEPALIKIKQDTAKFASERLGKDDWSSRSELSGPGGSPLVSVDEIVKAKVDAALNDYLNPNNTSGGNEGGEKSSVPV